MDELTIFNKDLTVKILGIIVYSTIGLVILIYSINEALSGDIIGIIGMISVLIFLIAPHFVLYPYYGKVYLIIYFKKEHLIAGRSFYLFKEVITVPFENITDIIVKKKSFTILLSDKRKIKFLFSRNDFEKEIQALNILKNEIGK